MSPDSFADRLSDYIDGALSGAEREELDAHLAECTDCRALVRDLRSVRREARSLPPVEPPEQVWESIADRIRTPLAEGEVVLTRAAFVCMALER